MANAFKKLAGLIVVTSLCLAAAPTTQQTIDQLGSPDPSQRESAENQLASMGTGAMDALRQTSKDPRPENRDRALRALRRIELFRLRELPTQQLALADAYLASSDFQNRSMQLNLLLESLPPPDAVLTRLIPIETDFELRNKMLYKLFTGYREQVPRIIYDDDDVDAVLTLLDGSATMWGQKQASDYALAMKLTGHLDEQITRWTAEQANGNTADQERAASILCQLYRVCGKYDQALKFARLSREQSLIFLILEDRQDWQAMAREPDDRWHDPLITAAYHACFTRVAGHRQQAVDSLSSMIDSVAPDTDASFSPSKLFLLNDLPEAGINLLLPRHPAVAFTMRAERGEIAQAIEIAERYPDDTDLADRYTALRQSLGELPLPATQPAAPDDNSPAWKQWQAAVTALDQKKFESAADIFGSLWLADQTHFDRLYLQGYALKSAGQTERGESLMKKADLMPLGDPQRRWQMAAQLDAAGLTDAAEQQRDLGLHTGGDFDEVGLSEIWNTRAFNAIAARQWQTAADALDHLCLINLSSAVQWQNPVRFLTTPALCHLCKARDARGHGDLSAAFAELQSYQQYEPMSSDMVLEWTPVLDEIGEHARADELFNGVYNKLEAILKKYPKSPAYLNELAWMSACCGRKLNEALLAAQLVVDLNPNDYQTMDTLAEVHFRQGNRQAAITAETRAMGLSNDPYLARQLKRFQSGAVPSTTRPGPAPE